MVCLVAVVIPYGKEFFPWAWYLHISCCVSILLIHRQILNNPLRVNFRVTTYPIYIVPYQTVRFRLVTSLYKKT